MIILRENKRTTEIYSLGDAKAIIGYKNARVEQVSNPNQKAIQKNDTQVLKKWQRELSKMAVI